LPFSSPISLIQPLVPRQLSQISPFTHLSLNENKSKRRGSLRYLIEPLPLLSV
jgi:hypothetical protein